MLEDVMPELANRPNNGTTNERSGSVRWTFLLITPYAGLCFPQLYTRVTPILCGFPFFYWYQFSWVLLTSALLGLVYLKTKTGSRERPSL